jgi:hypothetical protein
MSELPDSIGALFSPPFEPLFIGAAALGTVLLLILVRWLLVRKRPPTDRQIGKALSRLGSGIFRDLTVHDGIDGLLNIDYVILTETNITLVMVKRFEGYIYGARGIDEWTQMIRGGSYRFPNPLNQLQLVINTIRTMIPGIPVTGFILFSDNCSFPKDKPAGANLMSDLPKHKARKKAQVPEKLEAAWHLLKERAAASQVLSE